MVRAKSGHCRSATPLTGSQIGIRDFVVEQDESRDRFIGDRRHWASVRDAPGRDGADCIPNHP